jgi:ABC-type bacteriocin/lantibiotic exporter with double-glycine peptidase domain
MSGGRTPARCLSDLPLSIRERVGVRVDRGLMRQRESKRENPLKSTDQFRRLLAFVKPYRGRLIIALIAVIIGSVLSLAGPYMLQYLIDAVFKQSDGVLLNQITLLLVGVFAAQSVFYFIRAYQLQFIGERVMADLRLLLFCSGPPSIRVTPTRPF